MIYAGLVETFVRQQIVVEGDSAAGAAATIASLAPYALAVAGLAEAPSARLSTYTCAICSAQTFKEDWGPGRVRCPACRTLQPSASEL